MRADPDRSSEDESAAHTIAVTQIKPDGSRQEQARSLAREVPVALEFNGVGYAVLMASPSDLEDLAWGFAQSERIIDRTSDMISVEAAHIAEGDAAGGVVLRVALSASAAERVHGRVRHRVSDSSCGLCGIENLEQVFRPLPRVTNVSAATDAAVFHALAALDSRQPLNRATGAVHAAALCDQNGNLRLIREDVGRHNGFDKLIGAMLREGLAWDGGFALLSSRCSYELVEKAVLANCPLLVTISAPTQLAVERAASAGLPLRVLARQDAILAPIIA